MQKLLFALTIIFLIIIAPALLIALAAPDRLGTILVLWTAAAGLLGVVIRFRVLTRNRTGGGPS